MIFWLAFGNANHDIQHRERVAIKSDLNEREIDNLARSYDVKVVKKVSTIICYLTYEKLLTKILKLMKYKIFSLCLKFLIFCKQTDVIIPFDFFPILLE